MLTVACLVATPASAQEFGARLRGRAHLRLFEDRAALAAHVRGGEVAAVVVDLRDAAGRPTTGTVRTLRSLAPRLPLFARCRLDEADCRALLDFARAGVTDVVVHGTTYAPLLAALTETPRAATPDGLVARLRRDGLPEPVTSLFADALARIEDHAPLTHAARARGLSSSALRRTLSDASMPTPRRCEATLRLLAAAARLHVSTASVDRVAHAVGFSSGNALRNALHRAAGVTPSALRDRATYDALVDRACRVLAGTSRASRVGEGARRWRVMRCGVAMRGHASDVRRERRSRAPSGHGGRYPRSRASISRRHAC